MQDIISRMHYKYQSANKKNEKLQKQRKEFMEHLDLETLPEHRCLGCSQFFYQSANIYDPLVTVTPIETVDTIKDFFNEPENVRKLRATICSLLNSLGGVIMFDVRKFDRSFLAVGCKLDSRQQNEVMKKM